MYVSLQKITTYLSLTTPDPQTVSTSGSYVQCCPATGECPFYTTCSSNTLLAANATVPCDVDATLACNTGLIFATRDAADPASYLACWQTSLGSDALTIIQSVDETGKFIEIEQS